MKQKNIFLFASALMILSIFLASCLKQNLPEYPTFDTNEITLVNIEHRYNVAPITINGDSVVAFQRLGVVQSIDLPTSTINITVTIPAASSQFPATERAKVSRTKLWLYCNISTAASMKGIDGTQNPGFATDATRPLKYEVSAANGSKRVWTINVAPF